MHSLWLTRRHRCDASSTDRGMGADKRGRREGSAALLRQQYPDSHYICAYVYAENPLGKGKLETEEHEMSPDRPTRTTQVPIYGTCQALVNWNPGDNKKKILHVRGFQYCTFIQPLAYIN
ncbi:unnamed protein product [Periconia digitata]|uniref:Uncharacterized protein n=1 Tax=Periconia digitata TaxID=1303443 RepID=A0A9W4XKL6_9PLEO|nr:unnamed protein product [Periconia digitata]